MTKVWFITGCSRGLGLVITLAALKSGGKVIATCRTPSQLDHLIKQHGPRVFPLALDVADNKAVLAAVRAGHENFGRIDVLVNNAGYADTAAVEECTIPSFLSQINTNFLGVVYVTKAVLPIMRIQGSGHIFQVSSLGSRMASPGLSAYQSAKYAVSGFSSILAAEVAPLGIKVTVLEPGGIKTDWAGVSMSTPPVSKAYQPTVGAFAQMIRELAGNEVSLPEKIAAIVVDLLEEESPPLRLLVGSDAVEYGGWAGRKLMDEDEKWKELSLSSV